MATATFRTDRVVAYAPHAVFEAVARPEVLAAISWSQEFEDADVAARIKHIVEPANEPNLDRLESVLAAVVGPGRSSAGR